MILYIPPIEPRINAGKTVFDLNLDIFKSYSNFFRSLSFISFFVCKYLFQPPFIDISRPRSDRNILPSSCGFVTNFKSSYITIRSNFLYSLHSVSLLKLLSCFNLYDSDDEYISDNNKFILSFISNGWQRVCIWLVACKLAITIRLSTSRILNFSYYLFLSISQI